MTITRRIIDLVDDSVRASPGGPEPDELSLQRVPDPPGVLGQRPDHELDDCAGDTLGQAGELSICRGSDTQCPNRFGH